MTGELPTQEDLMRGFEERMAKKREEEAAAREAERESVMELSEQYQRRTGRAPGQA
jgi:hypothetical protein